MMILTEFLLARIAEDEGWARQAIVEPQDERRTPAGVWSSPASGLVQTDDDLWTTGDGRTSYFVQRFDPARVLAECRAKRRIVSEACKYADARSRPGAGAHVFQIWAELQTVVQMLALPYADHPDFNPAWRGE